MAALVTTFQVASQCGGTASFDGAQHALLSWGQRGGMRLAKLAAMGAHNISDFESRPHEQRRLGLGISNRKRKQIQGAGSSADCSGGEPKITGRGGQTAVAQEELNSPYVGSRFQQMDSIGVAERVRRRVLRQTSTLAGLSHGIADSFPG